MAGLKKTGRIASARAPGSRGSGGRAGAAETITVVRGLEGLTSSRGGVAVGIAIWIAVIAGIVFLSVTFGDDQPPAPAPASAPLTPEQKAQYEFEWRECQSLGIDSVPGCMAYWEGQAGGRVSAPDRGQP